MKLTCFFFVCSYDARESEDGKATNATAWSDQPPRGFGSRAHFDPRHGTLDVEGIKAHEGGLYRCRMDFRRSQTKNVLVNLTVIGKIVV